MNNNSNSFILPFLFLSLGFLVAGCGVSPGEDVAEVAVDAETAVVASKDDGCCGKCAAEAGADKKAKIYDLADHSNVVIVTFRSAMIAHTQHSLS